MTGTESAGRRIDTSRPHPARVYDWFLGGKDNYPVDEELGRRITAQGDAPRQARANRRFMERATRVAVREAGIRQFLDIGSGIPTEPNLHQIAQSAVPDARVVYVDNDPIVLAHAAALLHGTPEGATHYLQADAREPQRILKGPPPSSTSSSRSRCRWSRCCISSPTRTAPRTWWTRCSAPWRRAVAWCCRR